MANIIFPELLSALYHRTSKKKKMDCGNILPCCSNLSLIHLYFFFLLPENIVKGTVTLKTLLRWSFGSFNMPFLRVRVFNFEKEQQL